MSIYKTVAWARDELQKTLDSEKLALELRTDWIAKGRVRIQELEQQIVAAEAWLEANPEQPKEPA